MKMVWIIMAATVLIALFAFVASTLLAHNDDIVEMDDEVRDIRSDMGDQATELQALRVLIQKMEGQ